MASVLLLALVVLFDPRGRQVADALPIMAAYLLPSALVLGVVPAVRRWRAIGRELGAARRDVEVEQGRRTVAEERTRIARELHDVVAHGMSVIHMQAGASGFLLKDSEPEDLLRAVRVVAAGEALLAPSITRRLIENFVEARPRESTGATALNGLTDREREVLRLMALGMSNTEIAASLFIAEQTTKTHVSRILQKLGLRDRVQAVVFGYETGFVKPGSGGPAGVSPR